MISITDTMPLSAETKTAIAQAGEEFRKFVEQDTGLPIHLNVAVSNRTFEEVIRPADGKDIADFMKAADAAKTLESAGEKRQRHKGSYRRDIRSI